MKKIIVAIVIVMGISSAAFAETQSPWLQLAIYHPIEYPLANEQVDGARLSLIYANNPYVHGFDLGIMLMATAEMYGMETGLWNRTGDTRGFQLAIGLNYSDNMYGLQLAGIMNKSLDMNGVQFGISNVAQDVNGLQFSGFTNFAKELRGVQGIAVYNICENGKCLQMGGVNQAANIAGLQVGILANIASAIKGWQIGAYNYCDQLSGYQIGLVNWNGKRVMLFFNW